MIVCIQAELEKKDDELKQARVNECSIVLNILSLSVQFVIMHIGFRHTCITACKSMSLDHSSF